MIIRAFIREIIPKTIVKLDDLKDVKIGEKIRVGSNEPVRFAGVNEPTPGKKEVVGIHRISKKRIGTCYYSVSKDGAVSTGYLGGWCCNPDYHPGTNDCSIFGTFKLYEKYAQILRN